MKKLLLLLLLGVITLTMTAQEETAEITIPATILKIEKGKAWIQSRNYSRNYEVNQKEGMQIEKEYIFQLVLNKEQREQKHCSGCSGILPARLIKFGISPRQAKLDNLNFYRVSSRNGH
jgi:hypothetical protein